MLFFIAKAWSLDDMNKHFASLKAVDYGEMQSTKNMKATVGYDRLRFQFQQRDVQVLKTLFILNIFLNKISCRVVVADTAYENTTVAGSIPIR